MKLHKVPGLRRDNRRTGEVDWQCGRIDRPGRHLFLAGQTQIHLDEVEGLGNFLELEVVLQNGQKPEEGMAIAAGLVEALGVKKEDLIAEAYIDLIKQRNSGLGVREW
jgi:hypothetical protein